jgi:bifunctional non-homologous end joining protein LigD
VARRAAPAPDLSRYGVLAEYNRKRRFDVTPEPAGKPGRRKAAARGLEFVVQKHRASHLHYDFRLEHEGAMLSWAVAKGPSLDPGVRRLAMMTEPHPMDYNQFEGVIPEGEYGGGTVMIWDRGTW